MAREILGDVNYVEVMKAEVESLKTLFSDKAAKAKYDEVLEVLEPTLYTDTPSEELVQKHFWAAVADLRKRENTDIPSSVHAVMDHVLQHKTVDALINKQGLSPTGFTKAEHLFWRLNAKIALRAA